MVPGRVAGGPRRDRRHFLLDRPAPPTYGILGCRDPGTDSNASAVLASSARQQPPLAADCAPVTPTATSKHVAAVPYGPRTIADLQEVSAHGDCSSTLDDGCRLKTSVNDVEPWHSADAVARHLGVAKDTVYRWVRQKGLPSHRLGRLLKFRLSEVDAWAAHQQPTEVRRGG